VRDRKAGTGAARQLPEQTADHDVGKDGRVPMIFAEPGQQRRRTTTYSCAAGWRAACSATTFRLRVASDNDGGAVSLLRLVHAATPAASTSGRATSPAQSTRWPSCTAPKPTMRSSWRTCGFQKSAYVLTCVISCGRRIGQPPSCDLGIFVISPPSQSRRRRHRSSSDAGGGSGPVLPQPAYRRSSLSGIRWFRPAALNRGGGSSQ
jgi:hypothetical protein